MAASAAQDDVKLETAPPNCAVSSDEDDLPVPPGVDVRSLGVCSSISSSSQSITASDSQLSVQSVPTVLSDQKQTPMRFKPPPGSTASRIARVAPRIPTLTMGASKTSCTNDTTKNLTCKPAFESANDKPSRSNLHELMQLRAEPDTVPKTPSRSAAASGIPMLKRTQPLRPPSTDRARRPSCAQLPSICAMMRHVCTKPPTDSSGSQSLRILLRVLHDTSTADSGACNGPSSNADAFVTVDRQRKCVAVHDDVYESVAQRRAPPKLFGFDEVYTQDDCMTEICGKALKDIVDGVVSGGNDGCVFLYGPSKLDKLSLLVGRDDNRQPQPGLLPSAISWLFELINEQKEKTAARFSVRVSALDICGKNEQVRDLLSDVAKQTDAANSVGPAGYLKQQDISISDASSLFDNLSELRAPSPDKAAQYFDAALAARTPYAEEDDRLSHTVLTFHVYQYRVEKHGADSGVSGGRSRLHILDLGTGCRSRDRQSKALSFAAICNTILALLHGQRSVPYRDSKLNQLLRDCMSSLTGRFCWLSQISSLSEHSNDTLHAIQVTAKIQKAKRRLGRKTDSSDNGSSCDSFGLRRVSRLRGTRGLARAARVTNALMQPSEADYSSSSEQSCDTVIFVGDRLQASDSDSDEPSPTRFQGKEKAKKGAESSKRSSSASKAYGTQVHTARIPEEAASHSGSNSSSSHSKRGTASRPAPSRGRTPRDCEHEQWVDGPSLSEPSQSGLPPTIPPPPTSSQACIGVEFYHTGVEEVWIDGPKVFTRHNAAAANSTNKNTAAAPLGELVQAHTNVCEKGTQCDEFEDGQVTPTSHSSLDANAMLSDISEHTELTGAVESATDDESYGCLTDRSRAPSIQGSVDVQLQTEQLRSCPASMCTTPVRMLVTRTAAAATAASTATVTAATASATATTVAADAEVAAKEKCPATASGTATATAATSSPSKLPLGPAQPTHSKIPTAKPMSDRPPVATSSDLPSVGDVQKLKGEPRVTCSTTASPVHNTSSPLHNAPSRRPSKQERERSDSFHEERPIVPPTPPPLPPLLTAARADQDAQLKRTQHQRRSFLSRTPTHAVGTAAVRHSVGGGKLLQPEAAEYPPPGPSMPIGNLDRVTKWLQSLESQQQQRCTQYAAALDVAACESTCGAPHNAAAAAASLRARQSTASPQPPFVSPVHRYAQQPMQREISTNNDSGISDFSRTSAQNATLLSPSHSHGALSQSQSQSQPQSQPPHTALPPPPSFSGNMSQISMHPFTISSVLAQLQTDLPVTPPNAMEKLRETKDADVQTGGDLLLPTVRTIPLCESKSRKHGFLKNVIFSRNSSTKQKKPNTMSQSIFCGIHGVQTDGESACGTAQTKVNIPPGPNAGVGVSRDPKKSRSPSKELHEMQLRDSPTKTLSRMFLTSPLFGKKRHKHHRRNSASQPPAPVDSQPALEPHPTVCLAPNVAPALSTPISVNTQTNDSHMSIRAPSTSTGSGLSASSGIGSGTGSGTGSNTGSGVGIGVAISNCSGEDPSKKLTQPCASEALKYAGYGKMLRAGAAYDTTLMRDSEALASCTSTHNDSASEDSIAAAGIGSPLRCASLPHRAASTPPRSAAQPSLQTTQIGSNGKTTEQKTIMTPSKIPEPTSIKRPDHSIRTSIIIEN